MEPHKEHTVYFAKTNFRGAERTFGIRTADRRQHIYVIGKTGTGKSNLLKNLALQDIANGGGLAVVDPHGSFIEEVLPQIPDDRLDDVIYINPADMDYPVGFNILEIPDPEYKHLVASDLMAIFTKIWANVWSSRMEYILNNCILALVDTPGTTLLGIPRILVDKEYRQKIVANVKDPVVRSFWIHEYEAYNDRFRGEAIAPIQNKVGQFLSTPMIRNMVGQVNSSFNVLDIMNKGKILLVNVSKGRIGEDNAQLLGAMFITKIQLAAMERVRIPEEERKDFFLYVDEFQNFATESFATILSEARKYRLDMVIAHQYVGQLVSDTSTKVRDAVFGNVGTMITFRVGAADAEFLEKEYAPEFEIQDLVNLPNYNIYLKLMVNGVTSRPFSALTLPSVKLTNSADPTARIIERSRHLYARSRKEVEAEIDQWSGTLPDSTSMSSSVSPAAVGERHAVTCSNCGKITHVNFKPDGRRPVYCPDCMKKIQAGEIKAAPLTPKASFGDHLGDLGIEFSVPKKVEQEYKSPIVIKESAPIVRKENTEKTLSLKDLASSQSQKSQRSGQSSQPRSGPDLTGLKRALKDALAGSPNAQKTTIIKELPREPQVSVSKDNAKTLAPGEAVKL
ncbi:MAG: type IV secretion system DNA-binding domain-containing protein [Patescibacteria group bacterium]